jgi:hypothetical protein
MPANQIPRLLYEHKHNGSDARTSGKDGTLLILDIKSTKESFICDTTVMIVLLVSVQSEISTNYTYCIFLIKCYPLCM